MLNYKQTSLRSFFKVIENDCSYEIAQKKRQRPTATLSVKPVQYSHSEDDDTIDDDIAPPSAKKFKLAEEIAPCTFASPPTAINFLKRKNRERLSREFFDQDCVSLAKSLLGQHIVRILPDGTRLVGRIVETEAYLGGEDKASHSYLNKKTDKNKSMFLDPGFAYCYTIYKVHVCFNISARGDGAAVLIRAIEPIEGIIRMEMNRRGNKLGAKPLKKTQIGSGPAKICQAMSIDMGFDGIDLTTHENLFLERGQPVPPNLIVADSRIGVEYAGEIWGYKELRFSIMHDPYVSIKPKISPKGS